MSPTHANKRGVRYRYYVSHAILQNRKAEAGSIARVPAPEIETLVCDSVRRHLAAMDAAEPQTALADRELVQRHVARVIVKPQALDVWLIPTCEASAQAEDPHSPTTTIMDRAKLCGRSSCWRACAARNASWSSWPRTAGRRPPRPDRVSIGDVA
jgi:hypothetical protein